MPIAAARYRCSRRRPRRSRGAAIACRAVAPHRPTARLIFPAARYRCGVRPADQTTLRSRGPGCRSCNGLPQSANPWRRPHGPFRKRYRPGCATLSRSFWPRRSPPQPAPAPKARRLRKPSGYARRSSCPILPGIRCRARYRCRRTATRFRSRRLLSGNGRYSPGFQRARSNMVWAPAGAARRARSRRASA